MGTRDLQGLNRAEASYYFEDFLPICYVSKPLRTIVKAFFIEKNQLGGKQCAHS